MPCFRGLAVSIHTSDGPLPEHSIQRQNRLSRVTSYIPVPPPRITPTSGKLEPSTFAISITLLVPGLSVPYSTPKPTPEDPHPRPQVVGQLPSSGGERGKYNVVTPYQSLTQSPNETVAAYIYFDGRQKEEVATLLRRGEETWVNSRWVGVPESEGGGLAEREFLFREVGLERWLNGLDLEGKDAAAKIERRRQKLEKKRKIKQEQQDSDDEDAFLSWGRRNNKEDKGVLRYGADASSPLEKLSDDDEMYSSDTDDDPVPESTGQIKVALFRVLASGEIKKGEYSPQFDAHDDDEDSKVANSDGNTNGEADIDHTTSFAKPKTLDPKSISTQTVTGIDGPDRPYATFTFLYRGEKQLQKMGILKSKTSHPPKVPSTKRHSVQDDFANLKPLTTGGTKGFHGIRDQASPSKGNDPDSMESDDEEKPEKDKFAEVEGDEFKEGALSPEDARKQGELADGVKKIKLKRQHSFEPTTISPSAPPARRSPSAATPPSGDSPPELLTSTTYQPPKEAEDSNVIGSPLKKARASVSGPESEFRKASADAVAQGLGFGFASSSQDGIGSGTGVFGGELLKPATTTAAATGGKSPAVGPVGSVGASVAEDMEEEL